MEKTRLRRFDLALLQDQQAGSSGTPPETQLRFHFYFDPDGVGNENIFARQRADYRYRLVLPCPADRAHPVVAGGAGLCRHFCQRHFNYNLRQQKILRRNLRVRHTPLAVADLTEWQSEKSRRPVLKLKGDATGFLNSATLRSE